MINKWTVTLNIWTCLHTRMYRFLFIPLRLYFPHPLISAIAYKSTRKGKRKNKQINDLQHTVRNDSLICLTYKYINPGRLKTLKGFFLLVFHRSQTKAPTYLLHRCYYPGHLSRTQRQELNLLPSSYGILSLTCFHLTNRDKKLFTLPCLDLETRCHTFSVLFLHASPVCLIVCRPLPAQYIGFRQLSESNNG